MKLVLRSKRSNYDATCIYEDGIFKVCKGSKISPIHSKFQLASKVVEARNDKTIVGKNLITKKDVIFNSSSTSAQFVVAQSVNGNRAWKKEDGTQFKINKKSKWV